MVKTLLRSICLLSIALSAVASEKLSSIHGYDTYYTNAFILQTKLQQHDPIYLHFSSTDDSKDPTSLEIALRKKLTHMGYQITGLPNQAPYWIKIHIASIGRLDESSITELAKTRYGFSVTQSKKDPTLPWVMIADVQIDEHPIDDKPSQNMNNAILIHHYSRIYVVSPKNLTEMDATPLLYQQVSNAIVILFLGRK